MLTNLATHWRALSALSERGQVSAEYIGIIAVLGVLLLALAGLVDPIANAIKEGIIEKIEAI